jgi:FkbM family methyltransferase
VTALKEITRQQRHRMSARVARTLLRWSILRRVLGRLPVSLLRLVRPHALRIELLFTYDQQLQDAPRFAVRVLADGSRFECRTDDVIPRRIYEFGVWEPFVSAVAASRLGPGDTFIDIGANIGYYSVLASMIVGPSGHVVAIEPMAQARVQLERHLAINAAGGGWRVVAAAVAPTEGEIALFRGPGDNLGRSTTIQVDNLSFAGRVAAAPLVELVGRETIEQAALMKIDVEGDELMVLRGLLVDFPDIASRCDILVELTPRYTELRSERLEDVWRSLHQAGYSAYRIPNGYDVDFFLSASDHRSFTAPRLDAPPTEQTDVLLTAREQSSIEFAVPAFRSRRTRWWS